MLGHGAERILVVSKVNLPVRFDRSGPVPVSAGTQPAKIQNLNLNSKNKKFPKKTLKIFQVAMNLMVSNFLKNSFI